MDFWTGKHSTSLFRRPEKNPEFSGSIFWVCHGLSWFDYVDRLDWISLLNVSIRLDWIRLDSKDRPIDR